MIAAELCPKMDVCSKLGMVKPKGLAVLPGKSSAVQRQDRLSCEHLQAC